MMTDEETIRLLVVALISVGVPETIRFFFGRSMNKATIAEKTLGIADMTIDNLREEIDDLRKQQNHLKNHVKFLEHWFRENDIPVPLYVEKRFADVDPSILD